MREIEIKLRLTDASAVREALRMRGAVFVDRVRERNRFFDFPDRRLRSGDCGLRVRTVTPIDPPAAPETAARVEFAWKGPRREFGPIRDREELEVLASDDAMLISMLERIGLVSTVTFEKTRETWLLDQCEIALDDLPELGAFLEIESSSADAIELVARKLGFDPASAARETYAQMIAAKNG